ncbi:unnamed protein product [Lathyrus sativus]|nr:unnamed protein product [Lathyrus sativus]
MKTKLNPLFLITFIILVTYVSIGIAQDNSCINKLSPCLNYLNGTKNPPDSCCDPLKSLIKSDAACLCSLASNKGARQAEKAGINVTEAQSLPARCGQHVNPLSCLTNSGGSGNSAAKLMNMSWLVMMVSVVSCVIHMLLGSV